MKLKAELPMSSAMYCKLINTYLKTTARCCRCIVPNGECADIAASGKCKAFDSKMNHVLVFRTEDGEFATTRSAIAHALEVNQDNDQNSWIGETVDAVIEDYKNSPTPENEANSLYELLSSNDIVSEI
ncbi:hypothetical protein [Blautia sp. 1033sp1_1033st1_G9_1033SCRN_220408]|uniref:hypothetical protein n=1 Tax=Blautia sp. 1033sp1_1033st1_G9_1033SCRN_220408 TaxID=3144490 RepID=UPI0034A11F6A